MVDEDRVTHGRMQLDELVVFVRASGVVGRRPVGRETGVPGTDLSPQGIADKSPRLLRPVCVRLEDATRRELCELDVRRHQDDARGGWNSLPFVRPPGDRGLCAAARREGSHGERNEDKRGALSDG